MNNNDEGRLDYMIETMKRFRDGEKVEFMELHNAYHKWKLTETPSWCWSINDYRIAPPPPPPLPTRYTYETFPKTALWIVLKERRSVISSVHKNGISAGGEFIDYEGLVNSMMLFDPLGNQVK